MQLLTNSLPQVVALLAALLGLHFAQCRQPPHNLIVSAQARRRSSAYFLPGNTRHRHGYSASAGAKSHSTLSLLRD